MAHRLTFLIISVIFCGESFGQLKGSFSYFKGATNQFQRQTLAPAAPPTQQYEDQWLDFSKIDRLRELYLYWEKELWRIIRANSAAPDQVHVLQRLHSIHLDFFAEKFNENGVSFDLFDPDQITLHNEIEKINSTLNSIRDVYLQTAINDAQRGQILGFSRHVVNLTKTMDFIYKMTSDSDFFGYLKQRDELQPCLSSNILTESTNQVLYEHYVDISAAQLKAYSLVQLAYMFRTVYNDEYSVMLSENLRMRFIERTIATQARVKDLMNQSGRKTWNCDQKAHEYRLKGVSNQVTKLVQGYVDNEANLNPSSSCRTECSDYTFTKHYSCYRDSLCDTARDNPHIKVCSGNIVNCQFFEKTLYICPSTTDRSRNYKYITLNSGATLGKAETCEVETVKSKSWTRIPYRCSSCVCYCDEESRDSDRYFSLQPVLSDTEKNMVITGVSLIKEGQTFYWKITQRKLISRGQVESSTSGISNPYKAVSTINVRDDANLKEGLDYHTLNWENRSVNLDTLVASPGNVITGIKFTVEKGHLSLEIRATKFDFNTGFLQDVHRSEWISNSVPVRTPIVLERPDKSDRSPSKSIPDTRLNRYVDFQPTDFWKDAAQTTVPFIDTELVEPRHPTILSGIGLYYKGHIGYGGFIAPQIVTYDFAPHIKLQTNH